MKHFYQAYYLEFPKTMNKKVKKIKQPHQPQLLFSTYWNKNACKRNNLHLNERRDEMFTLWLFITEFICMVSTVESTITKQFVPLHTLLKKYFAIEILVTKKKYIYFRKLSLLRG